IEDPGQVGPVEMAGDVPYRIRRARGGNADLKVMIQASDNIGIEINFRSRRGGAASRVVGAAVKGCVSLIADEEVGVSRQNFFVERAPRKRDHHFQIGREWSTAETINIDPQM